MGRLDLLLGDILVLHSPFFGSGKLEYYLGGARAWRCVAPTPSSPSQTCHRCYLRRGPVFLRSLLRLVGHKVDSCFYFRRCRASGGLLVRPGGRRPDGSSCGVLPVLLTRAKSRPSSRSAAVRGCWAGMDRECPAQPAPHESSNPRGEVTDKPPEKPGRAPAGKLSGG